MSNITENDIEQAWIAIMCAAGLCDHAECHTDRIAGQLRIRLAQLADNSQNEIVTRSAPRWAWDVIDNTTYPNPTYKNAMDAMVLACDLADDEPFGPDDYRLGSV